jgi:hypothetical protein
MWLWFRLFHKRLRVGMITFVDAFAELRKSAISFVISDRFSVCESVLSSAWNNSAPTGRIFIKFDIWVFFLTYFRKIHVILKYYKNAGYFTRRLMHICDEISLNSSYNEKCFKQSCGENQNTHIMFKNFFSENPAVYEIMWKNMVHPDRSKITI